MGDEIRIRIRPASTDGIRTRTRPTSIVSDVQPGQSLYPWNVERYGDARKQLWNILAQHQTLAGLRMGCSMTHADTEAEAIELFEKTNSHYKVTEISTIPDYFNHAGRME